jgi:hypothetical protein
LVAVAIADAERELLEQQAAKSEFAFCTPTSRALSNGTKMYALALLCLL